MKPISSTHTSDTKHVKGVLTPGNSPILWTPTRCPTIQSGTTTQCISSRWKASSTRLPPHFQLQSQVVDLQGPHISAQLGYRSEVTMISSSHSVIYYNDLQNSQWHTHQFLIKNIIKDTDELIDKEVQGQSLKGFQAQEILSPQSWVHHPPSL